MFPNTLVPKAKRLAESLDKVVSGRGSKKDFIDIYFILQKISIAELFKLFDRKYKKVDYSKMHLLKSLVYFNQADKEPMPKMTVKLSWPSVKKEISNQVSKYLKKLDD